MKKNNLSFFIVNKHILVGCGMWSRLSEPLSFLLPASVHLLLFPASIVRHCCQLIVFGCCLNR